MSTHPHTKYRADVDGLRAIAVSAVVSFHVFPGLVHGGFVGVDIFFVISGFLITGLILKDLDQGRFSIGDFYGRRVRRIFPALVLVLAFCLALGWRVLLDDEYRMLGKHVAAGAGFVANFAFWGEAGYFDTASELKPLLHLWSLGIEEQFYIVWPALLVLAYRFGVNALGATAVLALVSFGLNIAHVGADRAWAFFLPQARLWELIVGGTCAYLALRHRDLLHRGPFKALFGQSAQHAGIVADVASVVGAAMILFGIFGLNRLDVFPGWWAAVPVIGSALVISSGSAALFNRQVLSRKSLVFVGLISYPLYLWHWPLLSFAKIYRGWEPGMLARILIVATALVLAWLTYEFVEKKIRFRKGSAVTVLLAVAIFLAGLCGYLVYRFDGFAFRFKDLASVSKAREEWEFTSEGGPDLKRVEFSGSSFLKQSAGGTAMVLFVGDSNAQQYWSRVDELIKTDPTIVEAVVFKTGGGCLPIPGVHSDVEAHCSGLARQAVDYATQAGADTVVFSANWWAYLEGASDYYFLENGVRYPVRVSEGMNRALASFRTMLVELRQAGKSVFVILNIPIGQGVDPRSMLDRSLLGIEFRPAPLVLSTLASKYGSIDDKLRNAVLEAGASLISPIDHLCADGACPTTFSGGEPIYKDRTHLRPSYVRKHATFIDPIFRAK